MEIIYNLPTELASIHLHSESDFHLRVNFRLQKMGSAYTRGCTQRQRSQQTLLLCEVHSQSSLVHRLLQRHLCRGQGTGGMNPTLWQGNKGETWPSASSLAANEKLLLPCKEEARGIWTHYDLTARTAALCRGTVQTHKHISLHTSLKTLYLTRVEVHQHAAIATMIWEQDVTATKPSWKWGERFKETKCNHKNWNSARRSNICCSVFRSQ